MTHGSCHCEEAEPTKQSNTPPPKQGRRGRRGRFGLGAPGRSLPTAAPRVWFGSARHGGRSGPPAPRWRMAAPRLLGEPAVAEHGNRWMGPFVLAIFAAAGWCSRGGSPGCCCGCRGCSCSGWRIGSCSSCCSACCSSCHPG